MTSERTATVADAAGLAGTVAATRGAGRPRDAAADEAILATATALLREGGVGAVTMSAVVRRSGVARATVYRRWPNREALLVAALRRTMGPPALEPSGDLEADVRDGARLAQQILASEGLRPLLPALVAAVLAPPEDEGHLTFDEFAPGAVRFAARYEDRLGPDAALVSDMVFGTLIGMLLMHGHPPTPAEADRLADIILRGIDPGGVSATPQARTRGGERS
jgi:AcrR family transcriptional regulator